MSEPKCSELHKGVQNYILKFCLLPRNSQKPEVPRSALSLIFPFYQKQLHQKQKARFLKVLRNNHHLLEKRW